MLLCKPESLSSVSVCLYSYMNSCEQHSPSPSVQFPCLESYVTYCCNQVGAKALLDQKKHEKRVEHFLRLCQESSFSRKLDLWNFLDLPRSRLVKYPLLLKEIQKCTPPEHPDEDSLPDAVSWHIHTHVHTHMNINIHTFTYLTWSEDDERNRNVNTLDFLTSSSLCQVCEHAGMQADKIHCNASRIHWLPWQSQTPHFGPCNPNMSVFLERSDIHTGSLSKMRAHSASLDRPEFSVFIAQY